MSLVTTATDILEGETGSLLTATNTSVSLGNEMKQSIHTGTHHSQQ